MPIVQPSALLRLASLAVFAAVSVPEARAADMPPGDAGPYAEAHTGGGYWAPFVPVRPAPTRFDIYGYPILGPGLLGRPAPHAIGVGCPPALEPAYDPDGNLAGYAPLQYCR